MATWLLKTEPDSYSYADLAAEGKTWWTGVTNALARKHLHSVAKGDRVLIYHTGKEKAIVGEGVVSQGPCPDPDEADGKGVRVEVKPVHPLAVPVTLAAIKADAAFEGWVLINNPRLSVVPVPAPMAARIAELSR